MLHFTIVVAIPRPPLVIGSQATGTNNNMGSNNYYFYGYINNVLYYLESIPTHMRENITITDLSMDIPCLD
jgi:hypothetical protein